MNLLQELSHEKLKQVFDEAGSEDVKLIHLVSSELVYGLPNEFLKSSIAINSFLVSQSESDWRATLNLIPEITDEDSESVITWTVGVPYEGLVLLMPDDSGDAPSLQLFARFGELWGRLILLGERFGEGLKVKHATVSVNIHCPPVPCGYKVDGKKCQDWCSECKCVKRERKHGFVSTACWCPNPKHDGQ